MKLNLSYSHVVRLALSLARDLAAAVHFMRAGRSYAVDEIPLLRDDIRKLIRSLPRSEVRILLDAMRTTIRSERAILQGMRGAL